MGVFVDLKWKVKQLTVKPPNIYQYHDEIKLCGIQGHAAIDKCFVTINANTALALIGSFVFSTVLWRHVLTPGVTSCTNPWCDVMY